MSRSARGGRVTQTRRRVTAPTPAYFDTSDDDKEEEKTDPKKTQQLLTTRPRATGPNMDSDAAETVGGGGKRQRTEDDGGNVDTECKELLGGNVDTELLVLATKPLLGVDTDDKEQPAAAKPNKEQPAAAKPNKEPPAAAKPTGVAASLACESCLYIFPTAASAGRHRAAVNPSGKATTALWRCAPLAPETSTLDEFKESCTKTKYVYARFFFKSFGYPLLSPPTHVPVAPAHLLTGPSCASSVWPTT